MFNSGREVLPQFRTKRGKNWLVFPTLFTVHIFFQAVPPCCPKCRGGGSPYELQSHFRITPPIAPSTTARAAATAAVHRAESLLLAHFSALHPPHHLPTLCLFSHPIRQHLHKLQTHHHPHHNRQQQQPVHIDLSTHAPISRWLFNLSPRATWPPSSVPSPSTTNMSPYGNRALARM